MNGPAALHRRCPPGSRLCQAAASANACKRAPVGGGCALPSGAQRCVRIPGQPGLSLAVDRAQERARWRREPGTPGRATQPQGASPTLALHHTPSASFLSSVRWIASAGWTRTRASLGPFNLVVPGPLPARYL